MDRDLRRQMYGRGPWLWHALVDGTRFCRCPHSLWYQGGPGPVEHRDEDGRVRAISWDGPPLPGPARRGTGAEGRW